MTTTRYPAHWLYCLLAASGWLCGTVQAMDLVGCRTDSPLVEDQVSPAAAGPPLEAHYHPLTMRSLTHGGHSLSFNQQPLLLEDNSAHASWLELSQQRVHTFELQGLWTGLWIRVQGKYPMTLELPPQQAPHVTCQVHHHGELGILSYQSPHPTSRFVFQIYLPADDDNDHDTTESNDNSNNSNNDLTLDITVLNGRSQEYSHAHLVLQPIDASLVVQQRRLNDEPPVADTPTSSPIVQASPTASPTTSPTESPTPVPTVSPTLVPTFSPSVTPSLRPSQGPSSLPSQMPQASPSSLPSSMPSEQPTSLPSSAPSIGPSFVPSTPPSISPSSLPSSSPSQMPSDLPSSVPSKSPIETPSVAPSMGPSQSPSLSMAPSGLPSTSPSLTSQPTQPPVTESPTTTATVVTGQVKNARLTLANVSELDGPAQSSWEGALDGWYYDVYPDRLSSNNLRLRRLLADGVIQVETTTVYKDQEVTDSSNTILYDQTVTYKTFDPNVKLSTVLTSPFESADLNQQLRVRLQASNPAFATLPDDQDVAAPILPAGEPEKSKSSGFGVGIIVGIAVGGAAVVAMAVLLLCRKSMGRGKNNGHNEVPEEPVAVGAFSVTDNEDGPQAGRPSDPSLGYGDQSLSTVDYDYSYAYGGGVGERSLVSDAVGTLGNDTQQQDMVTGQALGFAAEETPTIKEEIFEINAPSGKLGVVIDTPDSSAPIVHAVKDSSVLVDQVQVGDRLLKVDDEDVTTMTAVRVSKLISRKATNPTRKFTMMRRIVLDDQ